MPQETPVINTENEAKKIDWNEIAEKAYRGAKSVFDVGDKMREILDQMELRQVKNHWVDAKGDVLVTPSDFLDIQNLALAKFPPEPKGAPDEFDEAMAAREKSISAVKSVPLQKSKRDYYWKSGQYE